MFQHSKHLVSVAVRQTLQGLKSQKPLLDGVLAEGETAGYELCRRFGASGAGFHSGGLFNRKGDNHVPLGFFAPASRGFSTSSQSNNSLSFGHAASVLSDDDSQTAAAQALPADLVSSLSEGNTQLVQAATGISNMADPIIASGSDLWVNVPLLALNIPALEGSVGVGSLGVCTLLAMLAVTANHAKNHEYAQAGTDAVASLRKFLFGFWSETHRERAVRKWREVHSVSTPIPDTPEKPSTTAATNRIVSYWQAARDTQGLGTLSWITTLFTVILASNSFGLIPFSEAITGRAGLTLGLSFAIWGAVTYYGIKTQGTKVVNLFLPGGIGWQMAPFFVVLEMISYSFRAISLGVRLWANMLAGHQLIHIVTGIALVPVFVKAPTLLPVSITAAGLLMAMTGLESIVCLLQSGVFCLLTSFYLQEVLSKKTLVTPNPLLARR